MAGPPRAPRPGIVFVRIAYVLNTYPQPSQSFIRREIRALERQGHVVLRIAMRGPDGTPVDSRNAQEQARTEYVLPLGMGRLLAGFVVGALRRPAGTLRAIALTGRLIRNAGGGVVRHAAYLLEAAHVARRCAAEGVGHVHCHFATNAPAVAMLARAMGGPGFSFTLHGPEEFDAPEALSLPLKLHHAAFAVGVSRFGRSQLCRWTPHESWEKLKVVHCGIEPAAFPAPAPLPDRPPVRLVSIGRFVEQKGQMVLIDAMARLRDSRPDVHLTLVGDGPMRGDLERAITAAGLSGRVTLTGWVDETRVNAELTAAHAIVMPSFAEGLPMVLMEAMAAGRPVISTYVAGIPELVTPDCGWLVPAGDAEALAGAIARLCDAPSETLSEMGRTGRARALRRHDIDDQAARLMGHINAAVSAGA